MEEVMAQYYIPNVAENAPLLVGLTRMGRVPFGEVVSNKGTYGFFYRFSMPRSVQAELEKIFQQAVDLEQFRYEPTGQITAIVPAPIEGAVAAG